MSTHLQSVRNRRQTQSGFGLLLTLFGIGMMVLTLGAAIDVTQKCAIVEDGKTLNYCAAPDGKFTVGATGEVQLRR